MSRELAGAVTLIAMGASFYGWYTAAVLLVGAVFDNARKVYELRIRAENAELYAKKLEATLNSLCEAIEGLKLHGKGL